MRATRVGDLRKLLEDKDIPDNAIVVVPGEDHSYNPGTVCAGPIDRYEDGQMDEAHGDSPPEGAKRVTAIIVS